MKSSLPPVVAGLVLLFLAGCASTDSGPIALGRPVHLDLPLEEPVGGWNLQVRCGDSRDAVLTACGRPDATVGADVWIYRNCQSFGKLPAGLKYDTLLVAFAGHRVNRLKLVNGEDLRAYLGGLPRAHPAEFHPEPFEQ